LTVAPGGRALAVYQDDRGTWTQSYQPTQGPVPAEWGEPFSGLRHAPDDKFHWALDDQGRALVVYSDGGSVRASALVTGGILAMLRPASSGGHP